MSKIFEGTVLDFLIVTIPEKFGSAIASIGLLFHGEDTWGVPVLGFAFLAMIGVMIAAVCIATGVGLGAPIHVNDALTIAAAKAHMISHGV